MSVVYNSYPIEEIEVMEAKALRVDLAETRVKELETNCAVKDAALQAALPYLWTHADMMPTVSARDCTMQVAKEVEKALANDGSAVADVIAAAKPLYEAFLSRHGCFPLDKTSPEQILWNAAMSNMKKAFDRLSGGGDG